jgi:hypothetical protein
MRLDSMAKDALAVSVDKDVQSMANKLEWLIKQHYERVDIG